MTLRDDITAAVYDAVDEVNEQLPRQQRLAKDPSTPLHGPAATLDSLGLVNLIAATQTKIETALGVRISLVDGDLLAGGSGALATLERFITHVETIVGRKADA
jgi:hypothetical protein